MAIEPLSPPLITSSQEFRFLQPDSEKLNDVFKLIQTKCKNSDNPEILQLYCEVLDIMVK